ncbi:MAG: helix-turn-helix domain-containing protein [Actinobacteria bacterium]|nr:helix-turn-helix domain-containing protein [Actinomycetota bacterium]
MRLEDLRSRATISVLEAAETLGISKATAYASAKNGSLPVLRFGRTLRVPVGQLLRMLSLENTEGAASTTPSETDVPPISPAASERTGTNVDDLTARRSKRAGPR